MSENFLNHQTIAARKQLRRKGKIPKAWVLTKQYNASDNFMEVPAICGILTDVELDITSNFDATALLEKLKAGDWTAEQVTVAFCKRAAIAHQLTNCLTEIFFDKAIERARALDKVREGNVDRKLRAFHGLPVSLKDSFQVEGYDTSTGLACFVDDPAKEHSGTAAMLIDLGAVLYCKTNLPQTIMTGDSHNNVFGRTLNPRNTALTAGGSTGGEGALLALRGSVLGVGTDIAGSIRIPSLCNGIYGLRPSVGIVPHSGVRDLTTPGTDGVRSAAGPMATSLRDLTLFLRTTMQVDNWRYDSAAISIPWMNMPHKTKFRIGLVENDGLFTPSPPIRRGLNKVSKILEENRHFELIPIALPKFTEFSQDLLQYFTLLGCDNYMELFDRTGEPVTPSLKHIGLLSAQGTDLRGFFDLNVRRQAAAREYQKLFKTNELDAILMPPAPHTALPLDQWASATYTGLWNYLDYPAIIIPVDTVRDIDTPDSIDNAKYGADDARLYGLYTGPEAYSNAPIGIQLVGYRYMDEGLTHIAAAIDSIIHSA